MEDGEEGPGVWVEVEDGEEGPGVWVEVVYSAIHMCMYGRSIDGGVCESCPHP